MGGLHGTLGDRVRNQEEVESAIHNLGLLYESFVNVSALGRVGDACVGSHLKESLSHSLVYNDECMFW